MGKSTPAAPDYTGAAIAQGQSSRQNIDAQTAANRPNQVTPFGSSTWASQDQFDQAGYSRALQDWQQRGNGLTGDERDAWMQQRPGQNDYYTTDWTQTTTLDPELQGALDSQIDLQRGRSDLANSMFPRAQEEFGQPMNWDNFQEMGGIPGLERATPQDYQRALDTDNLQGVDPSQRYLQQAEDAIYNQWSNRQEPLMERAANQLDTRLRNQGLKPGDEAYDAALRDLRTSQGDARTNAQYQATIGAGQEASRMHGMDLSTRGQQFGEVATGGQFANSATGAANADQMAAGQQNFGQGMQASQYQTQQRQQQIAEAMQRRGFSLNEINAIISGQQVGMPSMPGFNAAGSAQPTNYSGAAQQQYGAALDSYNARNAGLNNFLGGLGSVASGFNGFGF